MQILTWHQVDFAGVVLSGVVAGYLMAMAGLWAGAVPGLVAFDIADFGRRYMVSDRPSAWLLGFASHLVNSILLVLLWAMLIVPNLPWPRPLVGLVWGIFLAIIFAGGLIVPLSGLGFMGRKAGGLRFAVTTLLLHVLWGLLIGLLYTGGKP
ncbi:MAG TPA: hypothetical protein VFV38_44520 [Ktedonobacteraceae bacterium]|nr:hypothetical protein [Ktedonobacteraceae bacterium]